MFGFGLYRFCLAHRATRCAYFWPLPFFFCRHPPIALKNTPKDIIKKNLKPHAARSPAPRHSRLTFNLLWPHVTCICLERNRRYVRNLEVLYVYRGANNGLIILRQQEQRPQAGSARKILYHTTAYCGHPLSYEYLFFYFNTGVQNCRILVNFRLMSWTNQWRMVGCSFRDPVETSLVVIEKGYMCGACGKGLARWIFQSPVWSDEFCQARSGPVRFCFGPVRWNFRRSWPVLWFFSCRAWGFPTHRPCVRTGSGPVLFSRGYAWSVLKTQSSSPEKMAATKKSISAVK